jgi:AraC-like DNA-binding protein
MKPLVIERYPPKNKLLRSLIKYFWVMRSEIPVSVSYKLLPVTNIDIVLNFSTEMKYISGNTETAAPHYSLTGIKKRYRIVNQTGRLNLFGISFYPTGLYPFLQRPLDEYFDQSVDLTRIIPEFKTKVEYGFNPECDISTQIARLENLFTNFINPQLLLDKEKIEIFKTFQKSIGKLTVDEYCHTYGLNPRKLQRVFRKYIGMTPKSFKRINRFQGVIRSLVNNPPKDLTSIAFDHAFYDQSHFINDFKSFSGSSPSNFLSEKKSMKQNLIYK